MSFLRATRKVTERIHIDCPLANALEFIQNPEAMIDINPLVIHRHQDPNDPNLWIIKDSLKVMGVMKYEIEYTARFARVENGTDVEVHAPAGTTLLSHWRVTEVEGRVQIEEEVNITTYFFLMGATLTDLKASHATLRERLAGRLEGREKNHATLQKTGGTEPQSHRSHSGQMRYTLLFLLTVLSVKYMSVQVAGLVLLALALLYYLLAMKPSDPYGTFHEDLNRVGDNTGERPPTEWLNMGYWEDTNEFPKACEALALKLVHLANCQEGGSVLDVGHGSGDSLLLHLQHPSVPRPSQLTGITSLLEHHKRASERVDKAIKASEQSGKHSPLVVLRQGDAVHRPSAGAEHPLAPTNSESYTSILALDCAYHFRTRETFLEQSFAHLARGGTIALADICFAREGHPLLRYIVSALGVLPRENTISPQEYIASMKKIGYTEISLEDITDSVLPGFRRFLSSRGIVWFLFSMSMGLVQGAGARFVLVKGRRP